MILLAERRCWEDGEDTSSLVYTDLHVLRYFRHIKHCEFVNAIVANLTMDAIVFALNKSHYDDFSYVTYLSKLRASQPCGSKYIKIKRTEHHGC